MSGAAALAVGVFPTELVASARSSFCGRAAELGLIAKRLTALSGGGSVMLIEGTAGMGKSRLLREGACLASDTGVEVAASACQDSLVRLDLLSESLHQHMPSPAAGAAGPEGWWFNRLLGQLRQRAGRSKLMVSVDDLQWADDHSVDTLERLIAWTRAYPVLWVLAARRQGGRPVDRLFARLAAYARAETVRLVPLDLLSIGEIMASGAGAPTTMGNGAAGRFTCGNPLLATELALAVQGVDGVGLLKELWRLRLSEADTEALILGWRLRRLDVPARRLVEVASVLGRRLRADDLAGALEEPTPHIVEALGQAISGGVLVADGFDVAFRHNRVAELVYNEIPGPVRLALHRKAGLLMLERGGSALPAAMHLAVAARTDDREVLAGLDDVARELMPAFPRRAAEVALQAMALTESRSERATRAVSTVPVLVAAGRVSEAALLASTALGSTSLPEDKRAELHVILSFILLMSGRVSDALREAELADATPGCPEAVYAAAGLSVLLGLVTKGDWPRARETAEEILAGSRRGADTALSGALGVLARICWQEGQVADALGHVRAAALRAGKGPAWSHYNHPRLELANMLVALGEFEEAENLIRYCREEIDLLSDSLCQAAPSATSSRLQLALGNLDEAHVEAEAGLALTEELATPLLAAELWLCLASCALLKGDLVGAAECIGHYETSLLPDQEGPVASMAYMWGKTRLAEAGTGPDGAHDLVAAICERLVFDQGFLLDNPAAAAWLVRTCLAVNDGTRALRVVACAERLAGANAGFPSVDAVALHARGLVDADALLLQRAAGGHRHVWAQASASEDAGVVLLKNGNRPSAQMEFERSLTAYDRAGAELDAARVRARLRSLGVRRSSRRPHRPVTGWKSLTDTELEITLLVAEGLTNAQVAQRKFLSRHTVDFHLRSIFRKLEIGSRVQLSRLAFARQEAEAQSWPSPHA